MDITLQDHQKKIRLNPPHIIKVVKTILSFQCIKDATLSIVFVNRQKIRGFNKKFLHRDHETDVLAFDASDQTLSQRKSKSLIGDIIISTDAVVKNAREFQTTQTEELVLYMIHGILHLLDYDDHKPADIKKIRQKEKQVLGHLGSSIKGCIK